MLNASDCTHFFKTENNECPYYPHWWRIKKKSIASMLENQRRRFFPLKPETVAVWDKENYP